MAKNLFKIQNKLYQADWLEIHPLEMVSKSDFYYLQLSNRILALLDKIMTGDPFPNEVRRKIAISVSAYFEDIISNLGLWRAMTSIHKTKFGRYLPFYELSADDYFHDEINQKDVQFLIWCILQRDNIDNGEDNKFINPENPFIELVALSVYAIIDAEYETAPENSDIYELIHESDYMNDFFKFREILSWLHYDSYLSMSYPTINLSKETDKLDDSKLDEFFKNNQDIFAYSIEKTNVFSKNCSPLAIRANHWMAEIVTHESVKEIVKLIDFKYIATYNILATNEDFIAVKKADSEDDILNISLNSLNNPPAFDEINYVMCGLVFFDGYWHVNGFASFGYNDKDEPLEVKKTDVGENNRLTYESVLKVTKNKQIVYLKDIVAFKRFLKKVFINAGDSELIPEDIIDDTNMVVFTHPEIGLVMLPDIALFLKDKDNPYYDKEVATKQGFSILAGGYSCSKQMIDYIITNGLLQDAAVNSLHGVVHGRKLVQENIEFFVRFFQPELYC